MGAIFLGVLLIGVVLCTNFVQRADDAINKEFGLDKPIFQRAHPLFHRIEIGFKEREPRIGSLAVFLPVAHQQDDAAKKDYQ